MKDKTNSLNLEKESDTGIPAREKSNVISNENLPIYSKLRWTKLKRLFPEQYEKKLLKRDYERKEYLRKRRLFKWYVKVCKKLANECKTKTTKKIL